MTYYCKCKSFGTLTANSYFNVLVVLTVAFTTKNRLQTQCRKAFFFFHG